MKRLAPVAGLLLLIAAVTTSGNARAYYLDAPHNESNGITCRTCHGNPAWWGYTSQNIDDTVRNAVCLSCHDNNNDGDYKEMLAPQKAMHSDLAMNGTSNWTTQCTDCHDPHYQPQLDWASVDSAKLWLAQGTVAGIVSVTDGLVDPNNPDAGATTVISYTGLSGKTIGAINWADPANWANKGGLVDPARAADGSRGLVFVPNILDPSDTYEIVAADASTITVKGKVPDPGSTTFGIIYGDNIRSVIKNAGAQGQKTVKFFFPDVVTGDYGGFVDDRAVTTPVGLCQVCHPPYTGTGTDNHWNVDNSGDKHNNGTRCTQCHDPLAVDAAFRGGADHTKKIVTFNASVTPSGGGAAVTVNCNDCHSDVVNAPDSGHLNRGAVNLNAGSIAPTSDGTGCGACHDSATSSLNGDVANRLGVTAAFGDDGPWPGGGAVDCSGCHPNKPQDVADGKHGGHSASVFGFDSNCIDCHDDDSDHNTYPAVVGSASSGAVHTSCTICHSSASGGDGTAKVGDPANGVDGDATVAAVAGPGYDDTATCTTCHGIGTTNSIPDAHHIASTNDYAQNGSCTQCHDSSTVKAVATNGTGHAADHSGLIADYANCTNCHSANVGTSQGAAVDPSVNKVHDDCVACHNTDASLKTLSQVDTSIVAAMPNPTSASNDGGGTCYDCHGEYFQNHKNIDHSTSRVTNATGTCDNCHNDYGTPVPQPVRAFGL